MEYKAYLDETLSFEERARDLVSYMTLEEKTSQTCYSAPAIKRLGIPSYNWWNEGLHGVCRAGTATVFPQAIGLAATFNANLVGKIADMVSTEARAKHAASRQEGDRGIYRGLTLWSPNINIFRDPRWGRGHETYGEDPYLTSELGKAFVKGLQGDSKYLKTAACAKHFAVHSGPEELRHEFDAKCSKRDLFDTYLPAFEALVCDADVESVMGAYNRVNGEPACGSKTLLQDILRDQWGFKGHVVSDCWALADFHMHHKVTSTANESVALALKNGCDLNCGNIYLHMQSAYQEGLITEEDIDIAVVRLMTTRLKLGMFEEGHLDYDNIPYDVVACDEHRNAALEAAQQSLVLLKNENNMLPLTNVRTIGVIGPNADSLPALLGNYNGTPRRHTTILEGISREAEQRGIRVHYAEGCHLWNGETPTEPYFLRSQISEAIAVAKCSDVIILCFGLDATLEGEQGDAGNGFGSGDKKDLKFSKSQLALFKELVRLNKPMIFISMTGSAMDFTEISEYADAIIQAWYPGERGGEAVSDLIFGKFSPSGKLPVTIYRTTEELPEFTDYSMENRTYRYMKNPAFYPFGFGLSYTVFEYSATESIDVKWEGTHHTFKAVVTNTGRMAGNETIQLYIKDLEASFPVPNFALKGVKNIFLEPKESVTVEFNVTLYDLMLVNEYGEKVLESGAFEVYISGGQPDARTCELYGTNPVHYSFNI